MVIRNKEGSLNKEEKRIVKALLARGCRNQDIQHLLNKGRIATINSARITEVKLDETIRPAKDEETDFFIRKKDSFDPRTGLNLYDDERLIRARESMILAVNVFNNPSMQFKTEVFAVLANVAWTYLLHEYFERKGVKILGKDGRSLLLSQMIERSDFPLSTGIKNNLNDIIEIRNTVEHKLLRRTDQKFFAKFQACCLNFDKALCQFFGNKLSLKHELSLALQFAKLDFEQLTTLHNYDVPEYIEALDARMDERLSDEEKADLEYQFKVIYMLENASKSQTHIQFIKPGSEEGKQIHNILVKHKLADEDYPFKPQDVWREVCQLTGKNFTRRNHTQAMYMYKVRPKSRNTTPENTNKEFCIYHKAHKDYTYSKAWIDYVVKCVSDETEFAKIKSYNLR